MALFTDTGRTRQHAFVAILLATLLLLTGTAWYSTTKPSSLPANVLISFSETLGAARSPAKATVQNQNQAQATTFTPFLNIIPGQDGTELFIHAGNTGEVGGTVVANVGIGGGHDKGWTMTYSNTVQAYTTIAGGFASGSSETGNISITTTLGLNTGAVDFNRAYVPASTVQAISSVDGNLQLSLVSADTINFNTYIVVAPSFGSPGPTPAGHRFVGSIYSVRAAGALLVTDKPMSLRLYYSDTTLAGADPHTLAVFAWDAAAKEWVNLGGRLFYSQQYVSVTTSRFTTYALMSTPAWRDEFDDFNGLNFPAEVSNVTLGVQGDDYELVLVGAAISGAAVSKPITPTMAFAGWDSLTFTHTISFPTTTLTVDVLSLDGSEVLTDVASGASLAGLDPAQYPSLKLRANLSSTVAGQTPALDQWQLSWQVDETRVYLPIILK